MTEIWFGEKKTLDITVAEFWQMAKKESGIKFCLK